MDMVWCGEERPDNSNFKCGIAADKCYYFFSQSTLSKKEIASGFYTILHAVSIKDRVLTQGRFFLAGLLFAFVVLILHQFLKHFFLFYRYGPIACLIFY